MYTLKFRVSEDVGGLLNFHQPPDITFCFYPLVLGAQDGYHTLVCMTNHPGPRSGSLRWEFAFAAGVLHAKIGQGGRGAAGDLSAMMV
jgi:hypothetical protein